MRERSFFGWIIVALVVLIGICILPAALPIAATDTCPQDGKVEAVDDELDDIVLNAGTEVCIKGGTKLVVVTADGVATLKELLDNPNDRGKLRSVSHYTILEETPSTTTTQPEPTTTMPEQTTTTQPKEEPTTTEASSTTSTTVLPSTSTTASVTPSTTEEVERPNCYIPDLGGCPTNGEDSNTNLDVLPRTGISTSLAILASSLLIASGVGLLRRKEQNEEV